MEMILRKSGSVVMPLTIAFLLISGIFAQVSSTEEVSKRSLSQEDSFETAESNRGNLIRVMVHKEFQLQPDGTYKDVSSDSNQKVTFVPHTMEDWDESQAESSPSVSYAYSPYVPASQQVFQVQSDGPSPLVRFTNADVIPQHEQQETYLQEPSNVYNQYSTDDYDYSQYQESQYPKYSRSVGQNSSQNQPTTAGSEAYPQYEIKQSTGEQFYIDGNSQLQPLSTQYSPYSTIPSQGGYNTAQMHVVGGGYSGSAPGNIQEILKKPAESNAAPYYSPKDNQYYEPGYDTTGGSGGYSSPGSGGYNADSYGPPPVSSHYGGGGYGSGGHKGGAKAALVSSLAHSVKGVTSAKAAQVSSVLHQKGQLGSQLLNSGGQVVQAAVHQKAQKAKLVGNVLSQAPGKLTSILATKAQFASAALAHGNKKIATIVHVKTQTANQASHLIQAKGKAASAVIKASGGTAADLIVAKGKGIANLIKSGGQAATAILDHKGNKVQKIASVLGSVGNKGHGVGISYGAELKGHSEGGYDDYQSPSTNYGHQRAYDELQDALKSVVESPASSYGAPPEAQQTKLSSAFRSIYDNFKAGQHQPSVFPLGSHSSPVSVTASSSNTFSNANGPKEGTGTVHSIGNSLTKMSEMFNNVANVFQWFNPPAKTQ